MLSHPEHGTPHNSQIGSADPLGDRQEDCLAHAFRADITPGECAPPNLVGTQIGHHHAGAGTTPTSTTLTPACRQHSARRPPGIAFFLFHCTPSVRFDNVH